MSQRPRDEELFDEVRLRRALRLDRAELPARLDAVAIAARGEALRPTFVAASLLSTVVAGVAGAALVGLAVVALPQVAPPVVSGLFSGLIEMFARAAVPVSSILTAAEQPTVPVAALAALAVAIAYEYAQRKERSSAVTS